MKRSLWLLFSAAAGILLAGAAIRARTAPVVPGAPRQEVSLTSQIATLDVTGAANGKFPTTSALTFDYDVHNLIDSTTGVATGQRQHKPVRITKPVDASSPYYLNALVTNEVLPTVVLKFTKASETGTTTYYTVRLTDAQVQDFNQSTPKAEQNASTAKFEQEEINFTYRKIVITWSTGNLSSFDTWTSTGV